MEALRVDLADAPSVPTMDAATQRQGVDLLAAVVAALTAIEKLGPPDADLTSGGQTVGGPGEGDEKHDHDRS